jgi:hypothetical protein
MSQTGQDNPNEDKTWLWNLINLNPALWIGLVVAVAALLGSFGLVLNDKQTGAITGLIIAVVAIVQAIWTRVKVTPNKKVVVSAPDPIAQPSLVAPGEAITSASARQILIAADATPK